MEGSVQRTVGQRLPRKDGREKVTGKTQYVGDVPLPGLVQARLLRSPHSHARIVSIDASEAIRSEGILAVVTGGDVPTELRDSPTRSRCFLAYREAVFHGQPVAAVLAEDPHLAEEALGKIHVVYEPLPAVVDPLEAARDDAPPVRPMGTDADRSEAQDHATMRVDLSRATEVKSPNIGPGVRFVRGDTAQGFAESDVVVESSYRIAAVHQGYMEPQGAIAHVERDGRITIWSSAQGQFHVRKEIASLFSVPEAMVRVKGHEIGGGFGAKAGVFIQPLCAFLSQKVHRPVKLVLTREEDLRAAIPAPQTVIELKMGATSEGYLKAMEAKVMWDAGAFPGAHIHSGPVLMGGYYRIPNFTLDTCEVLTNKTSVGAYRAPGATEVTFALESHIDLMARQLGMDPIEFRLLNGVEEGDLLPHGVPYPPISMKECLRRLSDSPFWRNRERRPNVGYGVAIGGWMGGLQPASAGVVLNGDGTYTVLVGSIDISGTHTTLAQIAAEELSVSPDKVSVETGDTSVAPFGPASSGSKITYTLGGAVKQAAEDARRQLVEMAAAELEVDAQDVEFLGDRLAARGDSSKSISLNRIGQMTTGVGGRYVPIFGRGSSAQRRQAPVFTSQAAKVEVEPETGLVTVLDMALVQDVGFAINPLSVEGQMQGGATQGLGIALWEELTYDEQGVLRNASLLDYRLPTISDVPPMQTTMVENPSPEGPYGARLAGEPSIIATSAAVANAVHDAVGVRVTTIPLTPERVFKAMAAKARRGGASPALSPTYT